MHNFFSLFSSLFLLFNTHPAPNVAAGEVGFHPYPYSNISVNWNSPAPDYTIFTVVDMLPGDTKDKSITITNSGPTTRPLTVKGTKTSELKNFSQILAITIFKNGSPIYGPKLLTQFFTDSTSPTGVSLGNLTGHATATYKFLVNFPSSAGNQYQLAKVVFNLQIGKILDVPRNCKNYPRDSHIFASFDCDDKIDDHDSNHCSLTHH
jgi:hypothetical protein